MKINRKEMGYAFIIVVITIVLMLFLFTAFNNTYDNVLPVIEFERYETDYWIYFNVTDVDWVQPTADYKIILTGGDNYVGVDMLNLNEPDIIFMDLDEDGCVSIGDRFLISADYQDEYSHLAIYFYPADSLVYKEQL